MMTSHSLFEVDILCVIEKLRLATAVRETIGVNLGWNGTARANTCSVDIVCRFAEYVCAGGIELELDIGLLNMQPRSFFRVPLFTSSKSLRVSKGIF